MGIFDLNQENFFKKFLGGQKKAAKIAAVLNATSIYEGLFKKIKRLDLALYRLGSKCLLPNGVLEAAFRQL
jgi:hypothetical protein